jgi:hypothetical protein
VQPHGYPAKFAGPWWVSTLTQGRTNDVD